MTLCLWETERNMEILIAPMWDWNFRIINFSISLVFILIAPMWDWNQVAKEQASTQSTILIAPMWDWNRQHRRKRKTLYQNSNCTNVGLKFASVLEANGYEPDSNCTNVGLKYAFGNASTYFLIFNSNCTNVGLKFFRSCVNTWSGDILIAPMWDWNIPNLQ